MATRREIFDRLVVAAESVYGVHEARQIAQMVLSARGGVSLTDLVVRGDEEVDIEDLEQILVELSAARPVQYILGVAEFCGANFAVGEGVLIPRPETEELVARVAASSPKSLLDVGTGSGCIAVSLARMLPRADVWAVDISEDALHYAAMNSRKAGVDIRLMKADALSLPDFGRKFDAVVSNPPYIPISERESMRRNVTEYEPSLALFVDDDDPLLFYRRIAQQARGMLNAEGKVWFEIHENFAEEVHHMLLCEGYTDVEIFNDINEKARIVCARVW